VIVRHFNLAKKILYPVGRHDLKRFIGSDLQSLWPPCSFTRLLDRVL